MTTTYWLSKYFEIYSSRTPEVEFRDVNDIDKKLYTEEIKEIQKRYKINLGVK